MNKQLLKMTKYLLPALLLCGSILPARASWPHSVEINTYPYGYDFTFDSNDTLYTAIYDWNSGGKIYVRRFINNSWQLLGGQLSITTGDYPSLTLNSADKPYVAFHDDAVSGKVSVMGYNGSSWNVVGGYGFSSAAVKETDIIFDSNDTLYVAYQDNSTTKANVMKYNGSSWVQVGSSNFSAGKANDLKIAIDNNDSLYVAYIDNSNSNYPTLMKYRNGSWVTIATYGISAGDMNMQTDTGGNIYIAGISSGSAKSAFVTKYDGSGLSVVGDSTINMYAPSSQMEGIDLEFDYQNTPYIFFSEKAPFHTFAKHVVFRYINGQWAQVGGSALDGTGAVQFTLAINSAGELFCTTSEGINVYRYENLNTWNGSTWSNGTPTSSSNVFIESSTSPGAFTCADLNVAPGVTLALGSSTINVNNDIIYYGDSITGSGTINIADDAIMWGDTMYIKESELTVASGKTLTTYGYLGLGADANGAGRIGTLSGTIDGDVAVQQYIPGKRAFRFFGHPFDAGIPLSQLTDEIDITGTGGADSGFTATGLNNPSAYWWDVSTADYSVGGNNPGWKEFTNADDEIGQYGFARIFVRGAKGEGLTTTSYTPSATTIEASGELNYGSQVVTLTRSSGSYFVACGNPFPSGVDMSLVTRGSNVGSNYYVWDPQSATAGAYVTNAWSLSYVLPMWGAFITTVSANTNNTLTFDEADKAAGGAALFKGTAPANWVELFIHDSTTKWDRLLINFDDNAMEVQDDKDGIKLYNPNLDFFTISKDDERLAVDVRPYTDGNTIPLGLTAYNRYNRYVIRTGMYDVPAGAKLYLHDKYLNTQQEMKQGFEYWFDVTSDTLSQGRNRFEINMTGSTGIASVNNNQPAMQLIPNPATNEVKVSFDKIDGAAQINLTSITGSVVYTQTVNAVTGSIIIPLQNVPAGIYIAELHSSNAHCTQKLIKQ